MDLINFNFLGGKKNGKLKKNLHHRKLNLKIDHEKK